MEWLPALDWHFRSFCRCGKWTPQELIDEVLSGARQLWVAWDGEVRAAVLTSVAWGECPVLVVSHGAGTGRKDWAHLMDDVAEWGRQMGCKRLEVVARPGWERVFKDMKKTHVVLEKRL